MHQIPDALTIPTLAGVFVLTLTLLIRRAWGGDSVLLDALRQTRDALGDAQTEAGRLRDELAATRGEVAALRAENAALHRRIDELLDEVSDLRRRLAG